MGMRTRRLLDRATSQTQHRPWRRGLQIHHHGQGMHEQVDSIIDEKKGSFGAQGHYIRSHLIYGTTVARKL